MKRYAIVFLCLCTACSSIGLLNGVENIYSKKYITGIMKKVCDWQIANPKVMNNTNPNGWVRSAFYTGVMETYYTTNDEKYLNQALNWAEESGWKTGKRLRHADDQCCGQTYVELYMLKRDPKMIVDIKDVFDIMIEFPKPGREDWWWCDALFMAPPALARLGAATGEKKYYDFMNKMLWDTTDFLFDEDEGLYYRDKRFIGALNPNGKKIFWSRGNGWVIAGLARILQYLPEDDPYHESYVVLLRKMAEAVARTQGEDGLWRSSLLDPDEAPAPETSGSGFFCFALAWGISNGYLDRDTYLPVVKKAWKGLAGSVHPDGKLGWVQQIGYKPGEVTSEDNQEYGSGAFLLAGSEMVKLTF